MAKIISFSLQITYLVGIINWVKEYCLVFTLPWSGVFKDQVNFQIFYLTIEFFNSNIIPRTKVNPRIGMLCFLNYQLQGIGQWAIEELLRLRWIKTDGSFVRPTKNERKKKHTCISKFQPKRTVCCFNRVNNVTSQQNLSPNTGIWVNTTLFGWGFSFDVLATLIRLQVWPLERFSNDFRKTKTKAKLPRPTTTGANSAMNQSQFLAITCNLFKAREKSRVHGAIGFGFGFASHWLKNWRESFKPIIKRSNRNHVISFYSHLKTALIHKPINPSIYRWISKSVSQSLSECINQSINQWKATWYPYLAIEASFFSGYWLPFWKLHSWS